MTKASGNVVLRRTGCSLDRLGPMPQNGSNMANDLSGVKEIGKFNGSRRKQAVYQ